MAISISACATPHWTNTSIRSVKQCKFVGQSVSALPIRIITVGKKRSPLPRCPVAGRWILFAVNEVYGVVFHHERRSSIRRAELIPFLMAISISACATPHWINTSIRSVKQCKFIGQSVSALPIRIITVGKKRSPLPRCPVAGRWDVDKVRNYCPVDAVLIWSNPKNAREVRAQVDDEDMAVMNHIRSDDWVVMLDEHGLDIGSERFAELVGDAGSKGASRLLFCIGGPCGHGRQIQERANISVKLSSMVLNHQIALLVLVEQLYRSWTVLKGQKYHH
ncbi:hypothetical protein SLEP1_g52191 [Rubroshorea leprosula]|uniref:RNA methyltransferase At5g10620 n=1 Tax=Rubroshorea leprosula TaxID=152421 RepID=A0AAV5M5H2_9ROSI|nr:hypothetical protein SLEP1_g52191 [Rubroshorea leprosula]